MVILNILCEGQTEERFVSKVLSPYLQNKGIVVKRRLLVTSKKKHAEGGILHYDQVSRDLHIWMKEVKDSSYQQNFFTTMIDLYGLPQDFPDKDIAMRESDCYSQVEALEASFGKNVNERNFIPYIQLHEFEALVFCGLEYLEDSYPDCKEIVENLKNVLSSYENNPEKINNSPKTAPSKRLIKSFANRNEYDKVKSGTEITGKVGIGVLRNTCRHFDEWLKKIESLLNDEVGATD